MRRFLAGLGLVLSAVGLFFCGFVVAKSGLPPARLLRSAAAATGLLPTHASGSERHELPASPAENAGGDASPEAAPDREADFEKLRSVGYVGAEEDAPAASGVLVHDAERADDSRVLWTSGHAPLALLMERDGTVLHTWQCSFAEAFPGEPPPDDPHPYDYFRKAWLYPDGSLLVIFEGQALVKLDRSSRVVWARRNHAHHDFHVRPSGEILVLTREVHIRPEWNPKRPILEGFVTTLDADGNELQSVSLLDAVERSRYTGLLDYSPRWGDLLHTNTLDVLDENIAAESPLFHAGDVLVSFNMTNTIAVADLKRDRLTWAMAGFTDGNHDPSFLENGNLLIFDNAGAEGDHSRVVEVDPFTKQIVWSYEGDEANGFYSWCCGAAHRLDNGNTLITESAAGRAFEVARDGDIVWEFLNPYRDLKDPELIGYIMEMLPVPDDQPLDWLAE